LPILSNLRQRSIQLPWQVPIEGAGLTGQLKFQAAFRTGTARPVFRVLKFSHPVIAENMTDSIVYTLFRWTRHTLPKFAAKEKFAEKI